MLDKLLEHMVKPPETDCPFEIGQTVRILKSVTEDGQTPEFWAGAKVEVIGTRNTMLHKEWLVKCRHENGAEEYFKSYEVDWRYIKNKNNKKLT